MLTGKIPVRISFAYVEKTTGRNGDKRVRASCRVKGLKYKLF